MLDESIHFALLTHGKSKYFENSYHANFDLLIKSYGNNSFNVHSNNIISDEDISRIQVFSQILDIFILLKSMIVVRSNIMSYSKSFFFLFNLILQFLFRKILLEKLGVEVLGLNTTALNLLQFINLAELGIGASVSYSLYKPLLNKNFTLGIPESLLILTICGPKNQ